MLKNFFAKSLAFFDESKAFSCTALKNMISLKIERKIKRGFYFVFERKDIYGK